MAASFVKNKELKTGTLNQCMIVKPQRGSQSGFTLSGTAHCTSIGIWDEDPCTKAGDLNVQSMSF